MGFMKFDAIPEAKYLCDTIEDLSTLLPRPSYGDTCWVISEAREYICNSKGEWLPKEKASKTTANVDLTGYATEDYVQEQIQNIEHPIVEVPSKLSELENDANYAQQAYVDAKVADLVNSAPETLDTIGEIAQALKDHQDVADAITEAIGKKADKEDLPSVEGLASEAFVTEAIQKIEFPVTDLSNYYTRDEVTQAIVDNAELPEGGLAHQYLVVDANGNKTWETQTHYLEERIVTNVAETTGTGRYIPYYVTHGLKLGKEYTITHNGVEYKCISVEFSGDVILGNLGMGGIPGATDTGEPFVFLGSKTDNVYVQYAIFKDNIEHTFSIEGPSDIATQLSDKFIPPTVPKTTFGDVGDTVVITEAHHGAPVKWTAAKLPKKLSDLENDIKFIDQEYVDTKVAELVDNAPETLNTLKEVADALNENASVAEALNQAIGNKVDKTDYPTESSPNQYLTTNAEGNKVWEDKTHYIRHEPIVVLPEIYIEDKLGAVVTNYANYEQSFVKGQTYNVIYNGKEYQATAWFSDTMYSVVLGNEHLLDIYESKGDPNYEAKYADTGEPFYFNTSDVPAMSFVYFAYQGNHTISINSGYNEIYVPLDDKYLPFSVPVIQSAEVGQILTVKEVDENSSPISWKMQNVPDHIKTIFVQDNSSFPGGNANIRVYDTEKFFTGKEIVDIFRQNNPNEVPLIIRDIGIFGDKGKWSLPSVIPKAWDITSIEGGYLLRLHFSNQCADLLFNSADDSIIVDPDWIAPTTPSDIPETSSSNQYLTTNENGEKVWEEKLAYIDYEEKLFIAESIWDGTQLSFPVAELEANNGDRCSIYLDDIEYKGTIVNSLHTYTVEFDEGVSFPWPYFNIAKPGYNSNIGGEPITWLVGKLRATIQLSTPHTINSKYLNFDIQSTGKYDLIINNYNGTGSAHANSVSINGGVAEGEQSIALSYASKAQGIGSLAAGPSTAKGTYSVALGAGTTANSRGSISFGEQNIEDVNKKYVMIAGNGHTDINFSTGQMTEVYSNAYTLDWNGNARFAGDVYIQGTDVNDLQDAKKVATEEYVENKYLQKNETYTKSLSFNGEIEGKEVFGDFFYKVSDDTPALEDWAGHSLFFEDGSEAFIDDMYQGPLNSYPNDGYNINNMVIVFYNDVEGVASKGIYFEWIDFGKVAGANYTAHKTVIPEELLDSNLVRATAFNELTDTVKGLDKYCAFMKQGDQIKLGNVQEYSKMQEMLSGANKFHATLAVTYVNEEGLLIVETCYAKSVMSTVDMSDGSTPYVNFSFETFAGETIRFKWNSDNTISDVSITKNLTEEDINTLIEAKIAPVE